MGDTATLFDEGLYFEIRHERESMDPLFGSGLADLNVCVIIRQTPRMTQNVHFPESGNVATNCDPSSLHIPEITS